MLIHLRTGWHGISEAVVLFPLFKFMPIIVPEQLLKKSAGLEGSRWYQRFCHAEEREGRRNPWRFNDDV